MLYGLSVMHSRYQYVKYSARRRYKYYVGTYSLQEDSAGVEDDITT